MIAELRRRLEHSESNVIREVDEFEENEDEPDDEKRTGSSDPNRTVLKNSTPQLINETNVTKPLLPSETNINLAENEISLDHDAVSVASSGSGTSVGAIDGDNLELGGLEKYGEVGRKCRDSHLSRTSLLAQSNFISVHSDQMGSLPTALSSKNVPDVPFNHSVGTSGFPVDQTRELVSCMSVCLHFDYLNPS